MSTANRLFGMRPIAVKCGIFIVFAVASLAFTTTALARPIDNIARARWIEAGVAFDAASNRVTVETEPSPAALMTLREVTGGSQRITFTPSQCGPIPANPTATASDTARVITAEPATQYRIGEAIVVAVSTPRANRDPANIDTISLTVTSSRGDREELAVFETAANSGWFVGSVPTRRSLAGIIAGDCIANVTADDTITLTVKSPVAAELPNSVALAREVTLLADPFGMVFDSETGDPVSGTRVTLRDARTGQPAQVFAEDGVTPWPSSVISGAAVTDGAGNTIAMQPGQYWFPLTALGRYRLEIAPPPPYTAPSRATPVQLAQLTSPDGRALAISDASFGAEFDLASTMPVEIDIPVDLGPVDLGGVDPAQPAIALTKTVSRLQAKPGDALIYTIIVSSLRQNQTRRGETIAITLPRGLRLRTDTIQIDGVAAPGSVQLAPDGLRFDIALGTIAAAAPRRITYAATIRADVQPGQLVSTAEAIDAGGRRSRASAGVQVARDDIASRMTIIGRVIAGKCLYPGTGTDVGGVGGVRIMLEDGSFAITDDHGRYRLDGVVPGTHVVQVAPATLPPGASLIDCGAPTRSAGSAHSRFIIGQGGSLARADFHLAFRSGYMADPDALTPRAAFADPGPSVTNAHAPANWLAMGNGPDGWLAPSLDHNPRVPAVKVAFRHRPGHTVQLFVDGKPLDPAAFDGTLVSPDNQFAVSLWRGVGLTDERTVLTAAIIDASGQVTARLERPVFFISEPARVQLITDQSQLIADGVTRPIIAVRITDRNGRPVRAGIAGDFLLSAPFESASQIDQAQIRQLSGIGEATARWVIDGDDGIARIELAPTMVSGALRIGFVFGVDTIRRRQDIETWIAPGDVQWTIVGLGEATLGARSVADNLEGTGNFASDLGNHARLAFYAKGRVLGKYLLTLAYDSARQRDDQPLIGAIDPNAYYTVFADNSQRRFDAATREKLYVRIETATFYALYGDFQTGFDQTTLGRYQRTATGIRSEARFGDVGVSAFGAKIASVFGRDEFQGNGLAGPYSLGTRDIVINSERVTIEVRDRFRSEIVVNTRSLTRFLDYTIDAVSGTITFSEPIVSRDFDLNPQIAIVEYETSQGSGSGGPINAGLRVEWASNEWVSADTGLRLGATAITDKDDGARTTAAVADLRLQIGAATELRSEIAVSTTDGAAADNAWLVEVQHQTGKLDLIAYARSIDPGYGIGQQSIAETGRRKLGLDARYQISDNFSAAASAVQDDSLSDALRRRGGQAQLAYRSPTNDARIGVAHFNDRLADGDSRTSTVIEAGAAQRLFDNRLELSAASSIALGTAASLDLPARHRLGIRYAIARDVRLTATYEIADGAAINAHTVRAGVEITPWQGGRVISTFGRNAPARADPALISIADGQTFAGFGLAQTIAVTPTLSFGATVDGNRIIGAAPAGDAIINPAQPTANGGPLGIDRTFVEDFTAVTLSGAWRAGRWAANGRGEYRSGQFADRTGLTFGVIRQIGEGSSAGGRVLWTRSIATGGGSNQIIDATVSFAHRPDGSDFSVLGRIEYRSDAMVGAEAGEVRPPERTAMTVARDALSRRLIGSVSANWSLRRAGRVGGGQRGELGVFLGTRYSFDEVGTIDLAGLTVLAGLDLQLGLSNQIDVGGSASLRANVSDGSYSYAIGPQISIVVAKDTLLTLGYNIAGFRDPDFSLDRPLDQGIFAAIRFKFDAGLLTGQSRERDPTPR